MAYSPGPLSNGQAQHQGLDFSSCPHANVGSEVMDGRGGDGRGEPPSRLGSLPVGALSSEKLFATQNITPHPIQPHHTPTPRTTGRACFVHVHGVWVSLVRASEVGGCLRFAHPKLVSSLRASQEGLGVCKADLG